MGPCPRGQEVISCPHFRPEPSRRAREKRPAAGTQRPASEWFTIIDAVSGFPSGHLKMRDGQRPVSARRSAACNVAGGFRFYPGSDERFVRLDIGQTAQLDA